MNSQEVETFIYFFCDRLRDHHSIQPMVIYGFLSLTSYQTVTDDLIVKMLQSLFAEVHVQSLVQADRRNVFNLFSNLLKTRINVLKSFSSDFVLGFIQAMDSERDPYNLLICFLNSQIVIEKLDYSLFVEDFFEVLSCYFPIDFTPPKDAQFKITKEDLVSSLRKCLTGTKTFASYAVPLYLDKMSSDVVDAKLDALLTFTECLKVYEPTAVEIFVTDIWLLIRKDYLLSEIKELASPYLEFTHNLVQCLSKSEEKEQLEKLIDLLIKDCLQTLKDPDMTIAVQCGDMICCVSNVVHFAYEKIVNSIIPPIETSLEKYSSITQRSNLLEMVLKILSVNDTAQNPPALLVTFVDHTLSLLYILLTSFDSTRLQVLSLTCIEKIVYQHNWFLEINFDVMAQHIFSLLDKNVLPSKLEDSYGPFIGMLSLKFPDLLGKYFITPIQNNLDGIENIKIKQQLIRLLKYCCKNNSLANDILTHLVNFARRYVLTDPKFCIHVLNNLTLILLEIKKVIDGKIVIVPLVNLLFSNTDLSTDLIEVVATCVTTAYRKLDATQEKDMLMASCSMLMKKEPSNDMLSHDIMLEIIREQKTTEVALLCRSIISQVKPSLFSTFNVELVLTELWQLMLRRKDNDFVLEQVGICCASILNKMASATEVTYKTLELITQHLESPEYAKSAVILLCWISKALVMNWQKYTVTSIELLIKCMNDEVIGCWAANGFEIIIADDERALNKESNAIIKLMYKQRFAQLVLPKLVENYHNGREATKASFMTAICNTLQAMPKQMLQKHLKSLMPLLMHSLAVSTKTPIIESTLTTIASVLRQNKDVVNEYVASLVSRLLALVTHERMNIRVLSIKCLHTLSSYPTHLVQPMKNDVVRILRPILDDKKRLVRKEVVACTNAWYLMTN